VVAVTAAEDRSVMVECPVCGRPLPPVVFDVETVSVGSGSVAVEVAARELDAAWWRAAWDGHPDCLIADGESR
jgi:hypothetical protein